MKPAKRDSIGANTVVEVELTSFGSHVLTEYIDAESSRSGHPNPKRDGPRRWGGWPARECVEMPLWEVLKVFGPHTVSSVRLPFEEIAFSRPQTREERMASESERMAERARDELRALATAVGISDDYKAPEQVIVAVRQFCIERPSRVPNEPGWWWLGKDVVEVSFSAEQAWRGPAVVDARTPSKEADDDIPF